MILLPVDSVLAALTRDLNTLILYIFVSIITEIVEDFMLEITECLHRFNAEHNGK
jgi:hypothetical protein